MQVFELDNPERLRAHLLQGNTLYEVRADGQGSDHWQAITTGDQTAFNPSAATPGFSAKSFFFAEREVLFRFEGGQFLSTLPEVEPQVLFGVHACDLQAVAYQDRFFADDPHYQARRAATLLVGVDCVESCDGGFCHTVRSGPAVGYGSADLVLLPRQDKAAPWLLLVASHAGVQAIEALHLTPATDDWAAERLANSQRVARQQGEQADIVKGVALLNAGRIDQSTWERLGLQCLGCSGCTSVCPTCSCFAPLDQPTASGGMQRERVWDSCLYQGFQKEASGHNPSTTPGARVQRFWFHKFGDEINAPFEHYGCVGCGRCDRVCPGGIGVHGVMHKVVNA